MCNVNYLFQTFITQTNGSKLTYFTTNRPIINDNVLIINFPIKVFVDEKQVYQFDSDNNEEIETAIINTTEVASVIISKNQQPEEPDTDGTTTTT